MFIVLAGVLLAGLLYNLYVKFWRKEVSEFDRTIGHLKFVSIFFGLLIYATILSLPHGYYPSVDGNSSPDVAIRRLAENQEKIAEAARETRQALLFIGTITAGYLFGLAALIGKVQKERKKDALKNDPSLKKPLGL